MRKKTLIITFIVFCGIVFIIEKAAKGKPVEKNTIRVGMTVGIRGVLSFSQLFSNLGVTPGGDLEVGYLLPFLERRLGIGITGGYFWARAKGSGEDQRLTTADGTAYDSWSWNLFQHQAVFTLRIKGRIFPPEKKFTPYVYTGPSLYLLWSVVKAEADGQDFGTNTERSTKAGIHGGGGVEFHIGPGRLFGEICLAWSPINHEVTGDKSSGNLGVAFGYILVF